MKKMTLLIDGDMFAFRACSSCEREIDWGGIWTLHVDLEEAKMRFAEILTNAVSNALKHIKGNVEYKLLFCFTSPTNFRKTLNPLYKANRAGKRKPVAYNALVSWIKETADYMEVEGLEADDCIGIQATSADVKDTIIISGDKDMNCIYGQHYDFLRDTFTIVSPSEAYRNFLTQTLVGDATDGYSGCPKIGKVTAAKILDADCSWDAVVKAYEKAGLNEAVAINEARMARILWTEDYDRKNNKVILWTP